MLDQSVSNWEKRNTLFLSNRVSVIQEIGYTGVEKFFFFIFFFKPIEGAEAILRLAIAGG